MADQALFDMPTPLPLGKPPKKSAAPSGAIKYTKYTGREKCDDCRSLILAFLMGEIGGNPPPASLTARYRRKQGPSELLLCAEHTQLRKAEEAPEQRNAAL